MRAEAQTASEPARSGPLVERSFPADFRWVRRVIHETLDTLQADGLAPADVDTVEIILAEALNNVVEHAYAHQDKKGDVTLSIRKRGKALMFEVRDRGRPMPNGRPPNGTHPMTEGESAPEGGYGWFLIRELVLDLIYDRKDGENILFMSFPTGETRA